MTLSAILSAPQVAPNQNQKETTINTATAIIEGACNDRETISLSGGNHTLTTDEFTKYFHQIYTGHSVARTVTIPNTVRFFAASNNGTANLTLHCNGSSGIDLIVAPGKRALVLTDGTDVVAISQGVSLLSDLSDVVGALSASNGQLLAFDTGSGTWVPVDAVANQQFFTAGMPTASQKVHKHVFARSTRFLSDFAGSRADADFAPTSTCHFHVYKNGTLVGSIIFATGSHTASFSTDTGSGSTTVTFVAGDVMLIEASPYTDATLADVAATLKGVLI
jgi:hypothetical protein